MSNINNSIPGDIGGAAELIKNIITKINRIEAIHNIFDIDFGGISRVNKRPIKSQPILV